MLSGETVELLRPRAARDRRLGEAVEWVAEPVPGVLWYQALTADANADDAALAAGDGMTMGVHWPKDGPEGLAGCRIRLPDGTVWDVVGDPHGHMARNCPGRWNRNFTCARHTAEGDG